MIINDRSLGGRPYSAFHPRFKAGLEIEVVVCMRKAGEGWQANSNLANKREVKLSSVEFAWRRNVGCSWGEFRLMLMVRNKNIAMKSITLRDLTWRTTNNVSKGLSCGGYQKS